MTESDKIRLRRLVTDLEPFITALQRVSDENLGMDSGYGRLGLLADVTAQAVKRFTEHAKEQLKRK